MTSHRKKAERAHEQLISKNELSFALVWIGLYVVLISFSNQVSVSLGLPYAVTTVTAAGLTATLYGWIKKEGLFDKYGLRSSKLTSKRALFYLPLLIIVSSNFWQGVEMRFSAAETAFYVFSMLCIGFPEEVIFRGLLFKALQHKGLTLAIVISSLTFGLGHLTNLINGSGIDLLSNLLQVVFAVSAGFMFTLLFHKGKSLLPCIAAHSALNALSAFASLEISPQWDILGTLVLCAVSLGYAAYLYRLPDAAKTFVLEKR